MQVKTFLLIFKKSKEKYVMQGNEELLIEPYWAVRRGKSNEVDAAEHVFLEIYLGFA